MITQKTASEEYAKALKKGQKEKTLPPVLDEILAAENTNAGKGVSLGIVEIPMDRIGGVKEAGRSTAFSKSFYPLLQEGSEFSFKWKNLYIAHMEEGIHDPVIAYEYRGLFYIQEGNKRVSVLRFCEAVSVPAYVTRIIPPWSDTDIPTRIYYQFMSFYNLSRINFLDFSKLGSYDKLQKLVGKKPDEEWTDEDRADFRSLYVRFSSLYTELTGSSKFTDIGDALLKFIELYGYHSLPNLTMTELHDKMKKSQEEFTLATEQNALSLQLNPVETPKRSLIGRLFAGAKTVQRVAFIHSKSGATSAWTYAHELGRQHIDDVYGAELETIHYDNATLQNIRSLLEMAILDGCDLIFTTAPTLLDASLQAAMDHPDVKILNCSLNTAHAYIRTYYARMYEPKFLMGAIAASMTLDNRIGYIADYPIAGTIAGINAFALGAKMINPRAKVYLEWSKMKDHDCNGILFGQGIHIICGPDMTYPDQEDKRFGLYNLYDSYAWKNLAMPVWNWGLFYERMIEQIADGTWVDAEDDAEKKGINYWWGMSSGIVDVICSGHLPAGTIRLIEILKNAICQENFNPFAGTLYTHSGPVTFEQMLEAEKISTMDFLLENIVGSIPSTEGFVEGTDNLVNIQSITGEDTI